MDEHLLREVLESEGATTNELFCTIHVLEEDRIAVIYSSHPKPEVLGGWQAYEDGVVGFAARSRQPYVVDNVALLPNYLSIYPGIASEMAIPVVAGGRAVAVVNFESTKVRFFSKSKDRFLELASRISNHLGLKVAADLREIILVPETSLISVETKAPLVSEVATISDRLLRDLARNPSLLYELTPRKFEELVGRILEDQGYSVTLTPVQKDGGFDLFAETRIETGPVLTLVECKKQSPENPVRIGIVRNLYGVLNLEKATNAMIVTTSRFTRDARRQADLIKYQLSLRDYQDLGTWLARYDSHV